MVRIAEQGEQQGQRGGGVELGEVLVYFADLALVEDGLTASAET
jgi:hypothetical protein